MQSPPRGRPKKNSEMGEVGTTGPLNGQHLHNYALLVEGAYASQ